LISGIPAYASNHGLAKSNALFTATGDFALILITEAEYNKSKANLAGAAVFATIYAFYHHEEPNSYRVQISSKSGGSGRIILSNPTNWGIEIRMDGPTGEALGYAAPLMMNTVLRVQAPGDYSLYPVFKRYLASEQKIYEVVPTDYANLPYTKYFSVQTNGSTTWDLREIADIADLTLTSGNFYLRIDNKSNMGIRLVRGAEVLYTSTGISTIAPLQYNVYSFKFQRNPDGAYPASQQIDQLKIGTPQMLRDVPVHTFKRDYIYTIDVTGTSASNLVLGEIVESADPIDIEAMFR
jgi:hypothetical protein